VALKKTMASWLWIRRRKSASTAASIARAPSGARARRAGRRFADGGRARWDRAGESLMEVGRVETGRVAGEVGRVGAGRISRRRSSDTPRPGCCVGCEHHGRLRFLTLGGDVIFRGSHGETETTYTNTGFISWTRLAGLRGLVSATEPSTHKRKVPPDHFTPRPKKEIT
jgi:hypothetical protein